MKMTKIALAIAALGVAPAAFALTPGQIDGTTARFWLSGASAPTNTVFKGMMTLCRGMKYKDAAGNPQHNSGGGGVIDAHMYIESTGTEPGKSSGDRVAYTCTVDTFDDRAGGPIGTPGTLEGKKVVVYHTVEGGSFNAYTPHLIVAGDTNPNLPANLKRLSNVEGLGAGCATGAGTNTNVDVSGIPNVIPRYNSCPTTTISAFAKRASIFVNPSLPDGGFSDTEYLINQLNLNVATGLATIGTEVPTNIGQAFGVAVSYPLYIQLQANDGLTASCPVTAGVPTMTAVCQPNLPSQRYSAAAYQAGAGAVDGSLFGGAAGSVVNLARRAITSGTQSASNLHFLAKPCATGIPGGALEPSRGVPNPVAPFTWVDDSTATLKVTESSSTGGVKTTLTNATNAGQFGLGVVSMENVPGASDKWAFVKLDRVSPNSDSFQRAEAIDGSYRFWYELVAFTAAETKTAGGNFPEGVNLMSGVNASLGNPELTNLTGLFITPVAGFTGTNVSKGNRAGNSCQPPVQ